MSELYIKPGSESDITMRMRDIFKAGRGEVALVALWCVRIICWLPFVRKLYRALLVRLVMKTGLFDEQYYSDNNPDVAESKMKAIAHYVIYGDQEGRFPMPFFDPSFYRQSTRGWVSNINALLHYSYVGRYFRKSPSMWFDVDYYLANNKDVFRSGIDPVVHYIRWGGVEGRSPSANFDGMYYLRCNPDVASAQINPLMHYLEHGRMEGRRTLPECNFDEEEIHGSGTVPVPCMPGDDDWDGVQAHAHCDSAQVDVVIPVYKGLTETLRCIYSVLSARCEIAYELIVVNDASPDSALVDELVRLSKKNLFTLVVNEENRGFVYTANRGMRLHPERDVVLLNSDTEVYDAWLDRLANIRRQEPQAGTVTPLSNNATICSYPCFLHDNPYPLEIGYRELDSLAARENCGITVEAPTGVGFCMYINRACLETVGMFDEKAFGRGYGEENDFCQRAIKAGWRNLIATDTFVRHWGSVSFQGEKARLQDKGLRRVTRKHPGYLDSVHEFIERHPLKEMFVRMDWVRLLNNRRERNAILVNHSRGGGTQRFVREHTAKLEAAGYGVFCLSPWDGMPEQFRIKHHRVCNVPNLPAIRWDNVERLVGLFTELRITDVYVHSIVDFDRDVPETLRRVVAALGARLVFHIHDYESICPRINLIDENDRYCGEPDEDECNRCLVERGSTFDVSDIRDWRNTWNIGLLAADSVVVPDVDVARRLGKYFPDVGFDIVPHESEEGLDATSACRGVSANEKLRIVVVGAISRIKGFDVLIACAREAKAKRLPLEFVVMGYGMDDRQLEEAGIKVTGKYEEIEGVERLKGLYPHVVWLPSVSPETYSYTLSLAIKTGFPVVAFNIGAIPGRLRNTAISHQILPLEWASDAARINDSFMAYRLRTMVENQTLDDMYTITDEAVAVYEQ